MQRIEYNKKDLKRYYRYHSAFYDLSRWSFLFGRRTFVDRLPDLPPKPRIMEVGCGTGINLCYLLNTSSDARIYGIDLSPDMLEKAKNKVENVSQVVCIQGEYGMDDLNLGSFNLILLSYTLTMNGDHLERIMQQVHNDLNPGGYVAVVDFHQSPFNTFRKWMKLNHVSMDGTILPILDVHFRCHLKHIKKAYLGLWTYFQFIGQRI